MAASDSTPLPLKAQALQITFGMWLNTGAINTGAAGLDSEISKDGGTFTDCTNEATEIGSSGTYTLDLTGTEMTADVVAIQVKSSTTNAITYKITIYPSSLGKIQVDVRSLLGTAWLTPSVAGTPDVTALNAPTATVIADALLNRDMSAVSDTNARSPLNALRFLRNKWAVAAGTLTVTKENDSTTAWTSAVSTDASAVPIVGNDPA